MSHGTPPRIPDEFRQANVFEVDPQWQRKFSIIWASCVAAAVLYSLPHLLRSIKNGRAYADFFGVTERWQALPSRGSTSRPGAAPIEPSIRRSGGVKRTAETVLGAIASFALWSIPGLGLNLGQLFVVVVYAVAVALCTVLDANLVDNANRAGFIAVAQLPVIFLFATKNSILSLLLGPGNGYEKLNFVHRWAGRVMFICVIVHGVLWIQNHHRWNQPILGEPKEDAGLAAFGLLCVIIVGSIFPVRKWGYQIFFSLHIVAYVAFFITLCYHTPYARPWIYAPLAFYGFDLCLRLFKYRVKDATVEAVNNQMTLIRVPFCSDGWIAGQHVRLRVFFSGRILESHPLTILAAPPSTSCIKESLDIGGGGMVFGASVKGDWTRELNQHATLMAEELVLNQEKESSRAGDQEKSGGSSSGALALPRQPELPQLQVMIDGPYGGSSIDLGRYEHVLLFAGGSGATFSLGLLDDIVGRCVRLKRKSRELTRRIEFAWCVRSFGTLSWFTTYLSHIAQTAASPNSTVSLHISVYVTCLCDPEAVPTNIPNLSVIVQRPTAASLLTSFVDAIDAPPSISRDDIEPGTAAGTIITTLDEQDRAISVDVVSSSQQQQPRYGAGGGVAVCASGPVGLTRDMSNAVAGLMGSGKAGRLGGVGLHTEVYGI